MAKYPGINVDILPNSATWRRGIHVVVSVLQIKIRDFSQHMQNQVLF